MAIDIKTLFQSFKNKIGEKLNALNTRINELPQAGGISNDAGQSLSQGSDSLPFYKAMTDAEVKAANERNANTNPFTDALKATVEGFTGDLSNKADLDPLTGKLEVSQIPKYSITDVIKPIETTLADFITNVNSYVFDIGDVIIIDGVALTHYLYDGEDRSLTSSYNEINPSVTADWGSLSGIPAKINDLSGTNTGDQDLSGLATVVYTDSQDTATLQAAKDYADTLDHDNVDHTYTTITLMLADQNSQLTDDVIKVTDASEDANVGAGKAYYFYDGTIAGTIEDYTLLTKKELDALTSAKIIAALGITPANAADLLTPVPLNAVFTDTVYDDTAVNDAIYRSDYEDIPADYGFYLTDIANDYSNALAKLDATFNGKIAVVKKVDGSHKFIKRVSFTELDPTKADLSFRAFDFGAEKPAAYGMRIVNLSLETTVDGIEIWSGGAWGSMGAAASGVNVTIFLNRRLLPTTSGGTATTRTIKPLANTSQHTLIAADFTDFILQFTANANEEISIILNAGVAPLNGELQMISTGNNKLAPSLTGVTGTYPEQTNPKTILKGWLGGIVTATDVISFNGSLESTATGGSGEMNVQPDWNVTDNTSDAFILNKPIPTVYSPFTNTVDGLVPAPNVAGTTTYPVTLDTPTEGQVFTEGDPINLTATVTETVTATVREKLTNEGWVADIGVPRPVKIITENTYTLILSDKSKMLMFTGISPFVTINQNIFLGGEEIICSFGGTGDLTFTVWDGTNGFVALDTVEGKLPRIKEGGSFRIIFQNPYPAYLSGDLVQEYGIRQSPNGTLYKISVSDAGVEVITAL